MCQDDVPVIAVGLLFLYLQRIVFHTVPSATHEEFSGGTTETESDE